MSNKRKRADVSKTEPYPQQFWMECAMWELDLSISAPPVERQMADLFRKWQGQEQEKQAKA